MNRFCCDGLCQGGKNCPLDFKDTVPDNAWLTRWMAENSSPCPPPPFVVESSNEWADIRGYGGRDFADTEPCAPPGTGAGYVWWALAAFWIVVGVWYACS